MTDPTNTYTAADDVFAALLDAVDTRQPILITYAPAHGAPMTHAIQPYATDVTDAGDLILLATDSRDGRDRSFHVDRVQAVTAARRGADPDTKSRMHRRLAAFTRR